MMLSKLAIGILEDAERGPVGPDYDGYTRMSMYNLERRGYLEHRTHAADWTITDLGRARLAIERGETNVNTADVISHRDGGSDA